MFGQQFLYLVNTYLSALEMNDDKMWHKSTFRLLTYCWWLGRSGSVVRHMNEVTLCRARLGLGWVTVFGRVYHNGTYPSQLGQLNIAFVWVAESSTSFNWLG